MELAPLAFLAGMISVTSPCCLPLVPGYLSYVGGGFRRSRTMGAGLLSIYSLGMGIPFLVVALAYTRDGKLFGFLRRHGPAIERAGGMLLVAMGVLLITGYWTRLFVPLIRIFRDSGWPPI